MTPAFGTTHFKDKRILIEFDEYVQLEDQQKEFFTSPFMEQKPVLSIRGRSVQIDLKEDLDSNRTYALDFGSSVVDNNEGNPYVGLRYVFSTGGEIDSLLMSGYTVDAQKGDTLGKVFLLFFDAKADSIPAYDSTIVNSKPLSVARSYPNGIFIAENLKPMDYRIYALEDNNNNMRYEPGVDRVAFLDTVFNPLREPAFDIWYDTSRRYMQADPQLMMRLFKEIPSKRQTYTGASRPQSNRVTLMFSAPFPQIDTLVFEGFDPSKILTEYVTPRRDTMTLWFDAIEEEMPDTLRGRLGLPQAREAPRCCNPQDRIWRSHGRMPAKKEKEKEKEEREERRRARTQPVQGEGSRRHDAEPGEEHRLRLRLSVDPGRQHSHRPAASGRGRKLRAGESLLRAGHRQTALVDAQRALGGGREIPSDDSGRNVRQHEPREQRHAAFGVHDRVARKVRAR